MKMVNMGKVVSKFEFELDKELARKPARAVVASCLNITILKREEKNR